MTRIMLLIAALLATAFAACQQAPAATSLAGTTGAAVQTAAATLLVFADFRCPHCAAFSVSYTPRILEVFQPEIASGQLTYEYRHLPVLGPRSELLARTAECVRQQGRFRAFHDALYQHQYRASRDNRIAPVDGPGAALDAVYRTSSVDPASVEQCLATGSPAETVAAHRGEGESLGVYATPTLVLNGQPMSWTGLDSIIAQLRAALSSPANPTSRSRHGPQKHSSQAAHRPGI